jgi:hypothetical protein
MFTLLVCLDQEKSGKPGKKALKGEQNDDVGVCRSRTEISGNLQSN